MPENELSKNIRWLRKKRQLTQEQLAAMVGVSAQAVSKWESGGYPDPSLLPAIADSLDAGIDELYGRDVHKHHSREELGGLRKYSELAELIADPECMRVLRRLEGIGEAVFISREELSSASGASAEKVDKVVDMLSRLGFVQQAELNRGVNTAVIYRFLIPDRFIGLMTAANDTIESEDDENV
ncbi:MAG: helix-turn-helix transcriptional regulator [Ruminococcus sp.]|nr:helix-turn-helix transcriptional regulator [Ruminococcus sp.]